jgi:predicted HTH transcriptional regulator
MYDSPEALLRQIRLGEDSSLELKTVKFRGDKVSDPHRDGLADEIAAAANTADCVFVLGVDDKSREIIGIPLERLDALERFVFEVCNDSITPPVAFRTYRIELPDETGELRPLLRVEVPRSLFVHKSPGGYFRRQGSARKEMPPDVLARLFQQRSQARLIRFDEQAVPGTSWDDLTDDLWRRFIGDTSEDEQTVLQKLSVLRRDDEGVLRATVSGILMCSTRPDAWLSNAAITAVRYRGVERDANYQLDAREIGGPLDHQVREALAFVERNMSVAAWKAPGRVDVPQYDIRAVFEALVNAVAHRDYSVTGSKIRIFMLDDRMEIYSPGALPNTLTVDSIALRQSTRNELVASLLARCPAPGVVQRSFMMDKRGEGVPIIQRNSLELSGRAPEYRVIDESELRLTLWAGDAARVRDKPPEADRYQ